jgi:ubiquinone/menaquinone biosynthesis C-methylase UbiE
MAVELEIRELGRYLREGDVVLDAGCANGYSTLRFAREHTLVVRGLDRVPELIELARTALAAEPTSSRVSFDVGDITAMQEPGEAYDRVIVIRVLINLQDEGRQQRALRECARVLKPGGLLLLSEATIQGWERLNSLRGEWGLPAIPMHPFNRYVDQDRLIAMAGPQLVLRELVNFSSTYFIGTRVIKPLLIKAAEAQLDPAEPDTEWNRLCATLPAIGDYGTQKLFVFERA